MKKILINDNPWQTRIAITRHEELQNIYFTSHTTQTLERSFFKGVVTKVLPGIQTAFVDIGQERAGFLHISEIDRELAIKKMSEGEEIYDVELVQQERPVALHADISKIVKEGDVILVQVSKEPVSTKGAKLTTCFTLPGRFIVLMPNIPRIGISKKIEEREERQRLREILATHLPEGMGAIIRTTSEHRQAHEILQDFSYLLKIWRAIEKKYREALPRAKIYEDIDLPLQIVRDHLDNDVDEVISDTKESQLKIYKFVKNSAPEFIHKVKLYKGTNNLFDAFNIEKQIEEALCKKVLLRSGGSIILETTEAMTVVDVNTGKYTGQTSLEETILKTNLEAAQEITRQLRLRNIGGLIVIDFIDMEPAAHRQKLFKFLEKTLKERDKFQSVVLKVSEFGLVQMTRKRSGKTLIQQLTDQCPTCCGLGFIKSLATECYTILREVKNELERLKLGGNLILTVSTEVFNYITNIEYNSILYLEKAFNCKIALLAREHLAVDQFKIEQVQ